MTFSIFENLESEVRSYCRSFPALFASAKNEIIYDENGSEYLDFFSGAGSVNYGHNDADMVSAAIKYLQDNGIIQGMDMYTTQKEKFISAFNQHILIPRSLDYKIQFTGPTGTNAVEAALKLARKITGRHTVACFTGGYHGMSLGALAVTANDSKRKLTGVQMPGVLRLPYDQFSFGDHETQINFLRDMLCHPGSGVELPAAFILECVQGEGGLNCASAEWLQGIAKLAKDIGALLIIDDIQAGCGRTGDFFSFEFSGIKPDIVCLSKSLSGSGLPMSVNLISRQYDCWLPGEHNGTFRGNNLAMVTATVALEKFWSNDVLSRKVRSDYHVLSTFLTEKLNDLNVPAVVCGRGLMIGMKFADNTFAKKLSKRLFEKQLIIETCGPRDEVLKCMPALTVSREQLLNGANFIISVIKETLADSACERKLNSEVAQQELL
ncbi:diaminobutyrate--2-oxoglutarate transaminase [Photobacterium sp. WH77]|uniref:diaminobutyrate--2-oxoglutarate transaminase n=1 Tax=unclassified Photobacterium TaxID=2628852 RepID=UPI001C4455E8|nr:MULTISPECIES: diaminobutyrate--2-oxoglutarate transaminase [unclassified Photobacterium]MBV7262655.1 diaminobutyrate--2-oxoglutarate transaminase [Photobacterium sp. WH24]MCG2837784.1 diaminobutyrate--2-oxoglutarate transaminase [Photobacterium sp. WH77]MCG2845400.1 diaminobutyrate--2-oxoglutarate transaminase [Photobacterium sp. WH80]MDO6582182.1 diaminobutyrate--2-oxoglutarate transaminase [Photobacterium sp. 2_MG-2023]